MDIISDLGLSGLIMIAWPGVGRRALTGTGMSLKIIFRLEA
jgi:hypothetical protein